MNHKNHIKSQKLSIFSLSTTYMRSFHITWVTFFICFFAWFGIAPLMPVVKETLKLSKDEIGDILIASVSATIFARLAIGYVCDRIGPRLTYTILLAIGTIPVLGLIFATDYLSFLICRLGIGIIGASFVVTQYHTSALFDKNVVGTANAVAAGWGNTGAFFSHLIMPILFAALTTTFGLTPDSAWRIAMYVPALFLAIMAYVYYHYTFDTVEGNIYSFRMLFTNPTKGSSDTPNALKAAMSDIRTWLLMLAYACCFGVEITFDNVLTLYFVDHFALSISSAGVIVACFALMNVFARALGGIFADKVGLTYGLWGKGKLLGILLVCEGIGLYYFSVMQFLPYAITLLLVSALFLKMSNGVTYAIVPFVKPNAVGSVAGIVGAGGNLGAVFFTWLFKQFGHQTALSYIGFIVVFIGVLIFIYKMAKKQTSTTTLLKVAEVS